MVPPRATDGGNKDGSAPPLSGPRGSAEKENTADAGIGGIPHYIFQNLPRSVFCGTWLLGCGSASGMRGCAQADTELPASPCGRLDEATNELLYTWADGDSQLLLQHVGVTSTSELE